MSSNQTNTSKAWQTKYLDVSAHLTGQGAFARAFPEGSKQDRQRLVDDPWSHLGCRCTSESLRPLWPKARCPLRVYTLKTDLGATLSQACLKDVAIVTKTWCGCCGVYGAGIYDRSKPTDRIGFFEMKSNEKGKSTEEWQSHAEGQLQTALDLIASHPTEFPDKMKIGDNLRELLSDIAFVEPRDAPTSIAS